ncbi:hypothetical protein C437_01780 [Haloarcula vallismortis ATCC 29715]|uniref:Uncharacterized protein n=1 Tax=Haloarcula vallismortis ATCC 29715 TaxID=662477 RepID=M0JR45_HALVA|nr:hypothetical protein [Haloarcula vallismortis]EMA11602.1 hypothetical protein C437_01780 [Haloarcula vallismortis ATCC 29715]
MAEYQSGFDLPQTRTFNGDKYVFEQTAEDRSFLKSLAKDYVNDMDAPEHDVIGPGTASRYESYRIVEYETERDGKLYALYLKPNDDVISHRERHSWLG